MESPWSKFRAGASRNLFGLALLCGLWSMTVLGQLEVPAQQTPQAVFGGGARQVSVVFHNRSDQDAEADIRIRILQASSGTAAAHAQIPPELSGRLKKLAQKGLSIVWLLPPDSPQKEIMLSAFEIYDTEPGTVLVAAADLTPDLSENPRSQLQLVRLAETVLSPQPKPFPFLPD
jgi:hypothetical protein